MATGLVTLGAAALSAGGQAASAPGAPAMTAPQNLEQNITFGGAQKESVSLQTAIIIGVAILGGVVIYVAANK